MPFVHMSDHYYLSKVLCQELVAMVMLQCENPVSRVRVKEMASAINEYKELRSSVSWHEGATN